MKTTLITTIATCTLILGLPQSQAGSLNETQVAGTAKWALHLNLEKLRATQVGGELNKRMYEPEADRKMKSLAAIFRFDPRKDLKEITVYGSSEKPEQAVALLSGTFDAAHLSTMIEGADDYAGSSHNGTVVHQWTDKGKVNFGSIHNDSIVISQGKPMVEQALDVLGGQTAHLGAGDELAAMVAGDNQAFLSIAADLSSMGKLDAKAQMFQHASKAGFTLHETTRHVVGTLNIEAKSVEVAGQINTMLAGIVAAGTLNEKPELNQLANSTKVTQDGNLVRLTVMLPTADLIKLMDEAEAWKKEF